MPREKLQTEVRREQIIQAVLSLLAAQDLQALSLAAVARRVGLVPSALYRHFRNKDEIHAAVLDHVGERLQGNVARVRAETPEALERLHRLLQLHVRLIRENPGVPRILFSSVLTGGRSPHKSRIARLIRAYLKELARIVREGQEAHVIRAGLEPDTVAVMFLGLFQPGAMLWFLTDGGFDITHQAERAWAITRRALEDKARGNVNRASQ
jgi:AcrR family transcriptional regulator